MTVPDTRLSPLQAANRLTRRAVEWLWVDRLALGKLAMLDGDPEQGKSLVALDLCARLSTGRAMPDGSPGPGVGSALLLQDEDGAADTVVPRLEALGADLGRVFLWHTEDDVGAALRFPANLDRLGEALAGSDARLLVVDPVMAFLDATVLANSDQGVRRALAPLARLAERHRCAVLLVRHLNKQGGTHVLYRGGGSIGLVAACRSGWLIGRDPQRPERRILAQEKNNLAPPQPSLAYELQLQATGPPTIGWLGPSPWSAAQLLAAEHRVAPQRDRASDFLAALLRDGPRPVDEVWSASQHEGHCQRTVVRAKKELGIRSQRVYRDRVPITYWLLPHQQLPAADAAPNEWTRFLEEQSQRFPPPCPLEED